MKPQQTKEKKKPLERSRTSRKMIEVDMERYKPRDWDYQSPKHMIRPPFVLGRSKRRIASPLQNEFPVFKDYSKPTTANIEFNKRELKPGVYRSYKLSQIYTLPGAVKIEESKVNDDKCKKDRIKVVRNKNLSYMSKIMNDYGSNVAFLPGSTDKEIEKGNLVKLKSTGNFRYGKEEKKEVKEVKEVKEKKTKREKVISPIRDRIKRKVNNKNKK